MHLYSLCRVWQGGGGGLCVWWVRHLLLGVGQWAGGGALCACLGCVHAVVTVPCCKAPLCSVLVHSVLCCLAHLCAVPLYLALRSVTLLSSALLCIPLLLCRSARPVLPRTALLGCAHAGSGLVSSSLLGPALLVCVVLRSLLFHALLCRALRCTVVSALLLCA